MKAEIVARAAHVTQGAEWFVIEFASGSPRRSAFHFRWLRHHEGRGRVVDDRVCSSELPDDLVPLSFEVTAKALAIAWSDARSTEHDLEWLQRHAYASERDIPTERAHPDIEIARGDRSKDELVAETLALVARHGVAIVRGVGGEAVQETERWIDAFERHGLLSRGVQLGRAPSGNEGFTDTAIQLHSCQPYRTEPPRYQLLQSIVRAPFGGDNVFVDAARASDHFAAIAVHDHALLTSVLVRFASALGESVDAPILQLPTSARSFRVRYSTFALEPLALPFGLMSGFYRAHDTFARLLRDPARGLRVNLAPSDIVLYDNHRMVHSRTPFEGPRWIRSAYLDSSLAQ